MLSIPLWNLIKLPFIIALAFAGVIINAIYYSLFEGRYRKTGKIKEDMRRDLKLSNEFDEEVVAISWRYYLLQIGFYLLFSPKDIEKWFHKVIYKDLAFEGKDKNLTFTLSEVLVETDKISNMTLKIHNSEESEFIINKMECSLRMNNREIENTKLLNIDDNALVLKPSGEAIYNIHFSEVKSKYLIPSNEIIVNITINSGLKNRRFKSCNFIIEQEVPLKIQQLIEDNISTSKLYSFLTSGGYFLIGIPLSVLITILAVFIGGIFTTLISSLFITVILLTCFYLNRRFSLIYRLLENKRAKE